MEGSNFNHFFTGEDHESSISDTDSNVTSFSTFRCRCWKIFPAEMAVELDTSERITEVIRRRFLTCLGPVGERTTVVAIHRRNWSELSAQAKLRSFQIYSKACEIKHGGSPNVKFGWLGSGKERIEGILSHGFCHLDVQSNVNGAVFLSPDHSPAHCIEGAVADEQGLKHVLLCRVVLGRTELIPFGSGQTHPSSDKFDSGVDDLINPSKYIIWSTNMNSHILPEYIVTFKVSPPLKGDSRMENGMNIRRPKSPWISFPELISVLAKLMPKKTISIISKYYKDFKERKFTRAELIKKVRQLAGDELLADVIKSCTSPKESKLSSGLMRNNRTYQK